MAEAVIALLAPEQPVGAALSPVFAVLGPLIFFGGLAAFPLASPNLLFVLEAQNLALGFFLIQLVICPWAAVAFGISTKTLGFPPDPATIWLGLEIQWTSYVAFLVGHHVTVRHLQHRMRPAPVVGRGALSKKPNHTVIASFLVAGFGGLWILLGNFRGLLWFVEGQSWMLARLEILNGTFAGAASTLLRPFLPFGMVLIWQLAARRFSKHRAAQLSLAALTLLAGVAMFIVSASFNRATIVIPLLGLGAAYSQRVKPARWGVLAATGALLLATVFIGDYRASGARYSDYVNGPSPATQFDTHLLSSMVQVYGNGPQFVGALASDGSEQLRGTFPGTSLLASLLAPVPILGVFYRDLSGTSIYNRILYGPRLVGSGDQVPTFSGEAYIAFGFAGVAAAFALLGILVAWIRLGQALARDAGEDFGWLVVAWWTAFLIPGSLAVFSQFLVFGSWPFVIYLVLQRGYFGGRDAQWTASDSEAVGKVRARERRLVGTLNSF